MPRDAVLPTATATALAEASSGSVGDDIPVADKKVWVSNKVCCMWLKERCAYGNNCKHMHVDDPRRMCSFAWACKEHEERLSRARALYKDRGEAGGEATFFGGDDPPVVQPWGQDAIAAAPGGIPMAPPAPLPCRVLHTVVNIEIPTAAPPGTELEIIWAQVPEMHVTVPPDAVPGTPIEVDIPMAPPIPFAQQFSQPSDQPMSEGEAIRKMLREHAKRPRHAPEVEAKLDEWVAAKRAKDFDEADHIRLGLRTLGIEPENERPTTKWIGGTPGGPPGPPQRRYNPEIEAALDKWYHAKRTRDFHTADRLKHELRDLGIEPDVERPAPNAKPREPKFPSVV